MTLQVSVVVWSMVLPCQSTCGLNGVKALQKCVKRGQSVRQLFMTGDEGQGYSAGDLLTGDEGQGCSAGDLLTGDEGQGYSAGDL